MRSIHPIAFRLAALAAVGWTTALTAAGVSVADLQKELAAGAKITIIDVRSPELYGQGHIPGAISIPASLCPLKNLPHLGKVVVYADGLGRESATVAEDAAAALDKKPGITADILKGGFAAWEGEQSLTTRGNGMRSESFNYITYADLKAANPADVVLVDLRTAAAPSRLSMAGSTNAASQPLTDLTLEFPGMKLAKAVPAKSAATVSSAVPPLMVLIDNGDGNAQKQARALKASGVRRYVILAGGELILSRHGQPGLQHASARVIPQTQTLAPTAGAINH